MTLPYGDNLLREWLRDYAPEPDPALEIAIHSAKARLADAREHLECAQGLDAVERTILGIGLPLTDIITGGRSNG